MNADPKGSTSHARRRICRKEEILDNGDSSRFLPIGFLIPEFPGQTHIAWWRVANQLRTIGVNVQMISTRRKRSNANVHKSLTKELNNVLFAWPPKPILVFSALIRLPIGTMKGLVYLITLKQSGLRGKIQLIPVFVSALYLSIALRQAGIERVFVHSCANAAHLLAMCNRISGVRYALRLGGDPDVYGNDHFNKMDRADFVLSASPTYFDELIDRHNVERSKLFWSWVGTDLSAYTVEASWPYNRASETLRVITVARLNETKGHMFILNAVRQLISVGVDISYTIVGEGPFRDEIQKYLDEHLLGGRIKLVGAKDSAEIADLLRETDVFVMASIGVGEAAPAAICEAMAAGVPVISSRIGAVPFMVNDGVDGFLVDQRDSAAIRDRLRKLAEEREQLAVMKRTARASSAQFDIKLTANLLLDLFTQASAESKRNS